MDEVIQHYAQYGIAGLFFIMWWIERRDKTKEKESREEMTRVADKSNEIAQEAHEDRRQMMEVVQQNTAAIVSLSEKIEAME